MGRCTNEELLGKIGLRKLEKWMEVDFAILGDIDNCHRVNTRRYVQTQGKGVSYNQYRVPEDMFHCMPEGCRNTGTLMLTSSDGDPDGEPATAGGMFTIPYDATEFSGGLATYYLYFEVAGTYTVNTIIADVTDSALDNSDVYSQEIMVTEEGFYPVVVDFSQVPDDVNGEGWNATEAGAIMEIQVISETLATFDVGISTIQVHDTIEDFEVNDVVKVACLSDFTSDITVDATDASCFGSGYDPTSPSIDATVTGNSVTPNYWKLNPLMKKGTATDGWYIQGDSRVVQSTVIDGVTYGYIQAPDMYVDECAFTAVQIDDQCNKTDAMLTRVNSPVVVALNERQFIVQDGKTSEPVNAGRILFNEALIGLKVLVSYPRMADSVEQYVATDDALNRTKVRMSFEAESNDGVRYVYTYNNVLITSFPFSLSGDESEFSFTISIQRDSNNNFFTQTRIYD